MTSLRPGFTDEAQGRFDEQPPGTGDIATFRNGTVLGPILLEPEGGPAKGRIDPAWDPDVIRPSLRTAPSSRWIVAGLSVLFGTWLTLSLNEFIVAQFRESRIIGTLAALSLAAGFLLLLRGAIVEWRSYNRLQQAEILRYELTREGLTPTEFADSCKSWFLSLQNHFPGAQLALQRMRCSETTVDARAILHSIINDELRAAARAAGRRAAMTGGTLIAVTPSPLLEGIIVTSLSIALVRQVAEIYGMRPGLIATWALFRRVAASAAGVSAVDLLAQHLADDVLHNLPFVKHLASAVPGTSLAAIRLYRLADITAEACSPISVNQQRCSC